MPLVLRTSNLPQRIKTSPSPPPCESQHESDEEEQVPDSPDSVESDASTGSWSKMSQISRGPPAIRRHPEYYIDSGDVVFQVCSNFTHLFAVLIHDTTHILNSFALLFNFWHLYRLRTICSKSIAISSSASLKNSETCFAHHLKRVTAFPKSALRTPILSSYGT